MVDFPHLLQRFATAVEINDGPALAALFTAEGTYDDGFFGPHTGAAAITRMLAHFHETGSSYRWEFFEPVTDGRLGYARYRFSYRSGMPGAEGKPVAFEGMSCFTFDGDRIAHYAEVFDRGIALAQQDFPPERIKRVLDKAVARQNAGPEFQAHLRRFVYPAQSG